MNKTTVLFPGGFKPLTGAHLALAQRYAEHPDVERVIMLIGPKDRDGITRADTQQIFDLIQMNSSANIEMQPTEFNSPITAAYEYLFALPEDDQGRYAMAASTKGDDYVRTKSFVPNVDKYITIGDRNGRKMPAGIDAVELTIASDLMVSETTKICPYNCVNSDNSFLNSFIEDCLLSMFSLRFSITFSNSLKSSNTGCLNKCSE